MDDYKRKELILKFEKAFEDTAYPGDEYIDRLEVKAFIGKHWKDITPEIIIHNRSELSFFSPEGLCFFLPAFILAIVREPEGFDTLPDSLIHVLYPPKSSPNPLIKFKKFIDCLSSLQKEAIYSFLISFKELEPDANWSIMENEREILKETIEYWRNIVTSTQLPRES